MKSNKPDSIPPPTPPRPRFNLKKKAKIIYVIVCVCVCVHVNDTHAGANGGQKVSDPLGLELQAIVSHHVDTGTQTRVEVLLSIDQPLPEPLF